MSNAVKMQLTIKTLFALLPLVAALPASNITATEALEPDSYQLLHTGSITYFHPGLGACGRTNRDIDMVVAISAALYDVRNHCGKKMRVTARNGRSAVVTVVDRCAGCEYRDIDLSPAAFRATVGDLGVGRQGGSWAWV